MEDAEPRLHAAPGQSGFCGPSLRTAGSSRAGVARRSADRTPPSSSPTMRPPARSSDASARSRAGRAGRRNLGERSVRGAEARRIMDGARATTRRSTSSTSVRPSPPPLPATPTSGTCTTTRRCARRPNRRDPLELARMPGELNGYAGFRIPRNDYFTKPLPSVIRRNSGQHRQRWATNALQRRPVAPERRRP